MGNHGALCGLYFIVTANFLQSVYHVIKSVYLIIMKYKHPFFHLLPSGIAILTFFVKRCHIEIFGFKVTKIIQLYININREF